MGYDFSKQIDTLEDARNCFVSMNCSEKYLAEEYPERYAEFTEMKILPELLRDWTAEAFLELYDNLMAGEEPDGTPLWCLHANLYDLLIPSFSEKALEKMRKATAFLRDKIPYEDRVIVAETINGRANAREREGLISKAYDAGQPEMPKALAELSLYYAKYENRLTREWGRCEAAGQRCVDIAEELNLFPERKDASPLRDRVTLSNVKLISDLKSALYDENEAKDFVGRICLQVDDSYFPDQNTVTNPLYVLRFLLRELRRAVKSDDKETDRCVYFFTGGGEYALLRYADYNLLELKLVSFPRADLAVPWTLKDKMEAIKTGDLGFSSTERKVYCDYGDLFIRIYERAVTMYEKFKDRADNRHVIFLKEEIGHSKKIYKRAQKGEYPRLVFSE